MPDPDATKKNAAPLVHKGKDQTLSGKMAVAYATYRASGEAQNAQLEGSARSCRPCCGS